jgi:hypothetical protein
MENQNELVKFLLNRSSTIELLNGLAASMHCEYILYENITYSSPKRHVNYAMDAFVSMNEGSASSHLEAALGALVHTPTLNTNARHRSNIVHHHAWSRTVLFNEKNSG